MVFDLPFPLLALFLAVAIILVVLSFQIKRPKYLPYFSWLAGILWISVFALTDNVIMNDRIDNVVATPATFNLTSSVNTIPDYDYNVLSSSTTQSIDGGGTNRFVTVIRVGASSELIGDTIECINLSMQDIGTASSNTITVGVFASNGVASTTFGTMLASSLTSSFAFYEFCLPAGQAYTIQSLDRIGVAYPFDTTGNGIAVRLDNTNPFDGTNTFRQGSTVANTWVDSTTDDLTLQLYAYEAIPDSVQVAGIGGVYTYENNNYSMGSENDANWYIRVYFTLFGLAILVMAIFQTRDNQ